MTKQTAFAAPSIVALALGWTTLGADPAAANTKLELARMECRYLVQTGSKGGASDAQKARFRQCVQERMKRK